MSAENPKSRLLPLLGPTLLVAAAMTALWVAVGIILPAVNYLNESQGMKVPELYAVALSYSGFIFHSLIPLSVVGGGLLLVAWLGKGPAKLVNFARTGIAVIGGAVACLALYLLISAGMALKLVGVGAQSETRHYKRALEQFAMLEAAEGRYEKLKEARDLKFVVVKSAAEFNKEQGREQVRSLLAVLPKAGDVAIRKQILATLCLFRDRPNDFTLGKEKIPAYATEAGAPPDMSFEEALEWIAKNLHRDGWEPLPLMVWRTQIP